MFTCVVNCSLVVIIGTTSTRKNVDFLKVPHFFPNWSCHFKELFVPVGREIRRSKILPVSWQLTNRTVSDISRRSWQSVLSMIFPAWIYNMIQIHSGERSRPREFVARLVAARPHGMKFASLTVNNLRETDCSKSSKNAELMKTSVIGHYFYNLVAK